MIHRFDGDVYEFLDRQRARSRQESFRAVSHRSCRLILPCAASIEQGKICAEAGNMS
jgi:hypothetical protein